MYKRQDGYLIKQGALEFAKEYDVDVKFVETPYAEIHQKLMNVGASGGSDFDVVFVESDFVAQMGEAGILEPLNEYVEKSESLKWDAVSYTHLYNYRSKESSSWICLFFCCILLWFCSKSGVIFWHKSSVIRRHSSASSLLTSTKLSPGYLAS